MLVLTPLQGPKDHIYYSPTAHPGTGLHRLDTPATTHSHNTQRLLYGSLEGKKEPRKVENANYHLFHSIKNQVIFIQPLYLGQDSGTLLVQEIQKINLNMEKLFRPMKQLLQDMEILVLHSKLQVLRQLSDKEEKYDIHRNHLHPQLMLKYQTKTWYALWKISPWQTMEILTSCGKVLALHLQCSLFTFFLVERGLSSQRLRCLIILKHLN